MILKTKLFLVLFSATVILPSITFALKEGDCEVCISVLDRFAQDLKDEVKKDPKKIETEFRKYCKTAKNKENRFVSLSTWFPVFSDDVFLPEKKTEDR